MKEKFKNLFGLSIQTVTKSRSSFLTGIVLFVVIIIAYVVVSELRHIDNPTDKIFPTVKMLGNGIKQIVTPDKNGQIMLLVDTLASMKRFVIGVVSGSILAIWFGISLAIFPTVERVFLNITVFISKVPLISVIPILFVLLGLGETMKIILIVIGIFFFVAIDIYNRVRSIPKEQLIKGLASGATPFDVILHIVFKQILPAAITSVRINLLSAWLFLIMSEAFAADSGLGYRIFVVRRYLAMDVIIPYVLWIALLSFGIDWALSYWVKKTYPWYERSL